MFLQDGDVLTVGKLQLMLVLFDAQAEEEEEAEDEWFEVQPDAPADAEADEPDDGQPESMYARPQTDGGNGRPAKHARQAPASLEGVHRTPRISLGKAHEARPASPAIWGEVLPVPEDQPRQSPRSVGGGGDVIPSI